MIEFKNKKNYAIIIISIVIAVSGSFLAYCYLYWPTLASPDPLLIYFGQDVLINQTSEIKEPEKSEIIKETDKEVLKLSKESLMLQEKFVDENERDVAFIKSNDDTWVINKNLKDKYKITDYYEKRLLNALAYNKLSPDGKYIVSEKLEGYTMCCGGDVPDIPVYAFYITKTDGTNELKIERPVYKDGASQYGLMFFDNWFPDSKRILIHFSAPDEPTQGSPFYEIGLDGKSSKIFTDIESFTDKDIKKLRITVIGTGPAFSPTGENTAFIINGDEIRLKDNKTKGLKTILKSESEEFGYIPVSNILAWSEDGNLLLVKGINSVSVFDKEGKTIFESKMEKAEEIEEITLSPDNKYIAGTYKIKGGKNIIFFINLDTKELKVFKLPEFENYLPKININNLIFSNNNKLYYRLVFSPAISGKEVSEVSELWVINFDTWGNYKLADDVLRITKTY